MALTGIEAAKKTTAANKVMPRTLNKDGGIQMVSIGDWISGFFPGELWYMYEYTHDESWKIQAEKFTEKLESLQFFTGDHDIGFRMYCSYGNGYRLTGNEKYKEILLQSAKSLVKRYNPQTGLIRSWDSNKDKWQYPVIIDNMMNLELLFWASKVSGDPSYYNVAVSHADKTIENHFRENGSSYHVVDYDTITGKVRSKCTAQGYADESAWARGQAWGAYGYTLCYRETKNPDYLKKAEEIISFIFSNPHLPKDLIPYWDYDAPGIPDEPHDVSAATITASALYELALYNPNKAKQYRKWADTILESLSKNYRATAGGDGGFILLHSTGHKLANSEVDVPIVYADYYYLEALLRKQQLSGKR
ncbi:glucuronyl hydrolase [Bacteroidia bacterium]|nr:glucuronyl hydrolase [Bacteroidia bacterium]